MFYRARARDTREPNDGTITDAHSSGAVPIGQPFAPGAVLGGRYQIKRFVAAGGMGEVYEADDQLLRDPVAIKLLRLDLVRKPGAQARFAEEIRLARRVTHNNVCRVFDVGVDGEHVFYTMELHSGKTLKHHLATTGPLAIAAACPFVRQMLAGIGAAHAAGVVHADLKPSNVLFGAEDRIVLTDFGLAMPCCTTLGCDCRMAHLVGTPAYMAPEQVTGGTALGGTDLFSFGVILFELLTGQLPWRGDTAIEQARARLQGDPPSARAVRPTIDARWDELIRACLQREPSRRPASTSDIARALGLA